jgi:hypothetical protein
MPGGSARSDLLQDVLLSAGQEAEALLRRARNPARPVEAVEETAAHTLFEHQNDSFVLVECGPAPGWGSREEVAPLLREVRPGHPQRR